MRRVALGEVIKVKSGDGLVAKNMAPDGKFPVYGGNGINGYHDAYMFEEPKVILGRVGVYCGVVHLTKPKAWVTDNALYVREYLQPVETAYLVEALKAANLNQYASQAAQPLISGSRIYPVRIPLPPLAEQKRIAGILDAADALRAKRRESLAQLDTLLQSTFLDMFGDAVTNPKGWEVNNMGETCEILTGFAFPSGKFVEPGAGIALCRGINVALGKTNWKDRVDWPLPYDEKLSRFEICEGDIVLAMDRPWIAGGLKVAVMESTDLPALLVQRVARIRAKDAPMQSLVYALIRSDFFEHHCNPTETTIPHISPKDLKSFPLIQPSLHLQRRFAAIVEAVEHQKARLRTHLAELDALFASLQSRAFNGEL